MQIKATERNISFGVRIILIVDSERELHDIKTKLLKEGLCKPVSTSKKNKKFLVVPSLVQFGFY